MSYLNVDEIESAVRLLSETHPGRARLIELPNRSHEGRAIHALQIGNAAGGSAAIFVGGLHAREWVPPDALVYLGADLLEAYENGTGLRYGNPGIYFPPDRIRLILDTVGIVLLPCANPDGRHFSQTADRDWRKNRRPAGAGGAATCAGVDLNRNFDFLWDFKKYFADGFVSASDDPCHKYLYVGPTPNSEPETRNVVWLLDAHPMTKWFVDVHSAIPAVLHSWGIDENQESDPTKNFRNAIYDGIRGISSDVYAEFITQLDRDSVEALAAVMQASIAKVNGDRYDVAQGYSLYATSGASDDYAYSRHLQAGQKAKILSFTMECGHEFQPENLGQAETVMREVAAGLIGFLLAALGEPVA